MAKFEVYVRTNKINSKVTKIVEIDDEELAEMSEDDLEEIMRERMLGMIEWSYDRKDD